MVNILIIFIYIMFGLTVASSKVASLEVLTHASLFGFLMFHGKVGLPIILKFKNNLKILLSTILFFSIWMWLRLPYIYEFYGLSILVFYFGLKNNEFRKEKFINSISIFNFISVALMLLQPNKFLEIDILTFTQSSVIFAVASILLLLKEKNLNMISLVVLNFFCFVDTSLQKNDIFDALIGLSLLLSLLNIHEVRSFKVLVLGFLSLVMGLLFSYYIDYYLIEEALSLNEVYYSNHPNAFLFINGMFFALNSYAMIVIYKIKSVKKIKGEKTC